MSLTARPLTADQSNSAVGYGDRLLLKIYRRPEPGPHLEVETLRALTEARCPRTPGCTAPCSAAPEPWSSA